MSDIKVPVIRGQIGKWRYYVGAMTFGQIAERVAPSINQLYPSESLSTLLQRELTDNYISIKDYICNDQERFFNALILAIYNGDPQWLEVEFNGEYDEVNSVGFLELPQDVVIFPVDGQHRVAGIIESIKENPELTREQVPVVFIAHEDSPTGIQRTRKLFSTLNRRAKPVGENAQIALDEDDVVAIATRELIASCPLFWEKRLENGNGKQIPSKDKDAFTSLVALYQCNSILIQSQLGLAGKKYKNFLFFRPPEKTVEELTQYIVNFWSLFCTKIDSIQEYLKKDTSPAESFRNNQGGNILFRPVVITEYVKATLEIAKKLEGDYDIAFEKLNSIKMDLSAAPWKGVLWDGKKMITRADKKLIMLLILQMCGKDYLSGEDRQVLVDRYISATNFEGDPKEIVRFLDEL